MVAATRQAAEAQTIRAAEAEVQAQPVKTSIHLQTVEMEALVKSGQRRLETTMLEEAEAEVILVGDLVAPEEAGLDVAVVEMEQRGA